MSYRAEITKKQKPPYLCKAWAPILRQLPGSSIKPQNKIIQNHQKAQYSQLLVCKIIQVWGSKVQSIVLWTSWNEPSIFTFNLHFNLRGMHLKALFLLIVSGMQRRGLFLRMVVINITLQVQLQPQETGVTHRDVSIFIYNPVNQFMVINWVILERPQVGDELLKCTLHWWAQPRFSWFLSGLNLFSYHKSQLLVSRAWKSI